MAAPMMAPAPLVRAFKNVGILTALAVVPALMLAAYVAVAARPGVRETVDFRVFYAAAKAYMHGRSPYPAHPATLTWAHGAQHSYAYPPIVAVVAIPFALLPYHVAAIVWVLIAAGAVGLSLWLLEIRDWRCYGAVYLWPATLTAISVGTISTLLLLGIATVWRFRSRTGAASVAAVLTVSAKLFLWPLLVWLWLSGRRAVATWAVLGTCLAAIVAWSIIRFDGITSYVSLLRRLSSVESREGYSAAWAVAGTAGIGVIAAVCAAAAYRFRWRGRQALAAAVVAALLLTPILWLHYLVLLAATLPRRFSLLWLVPALLWLTPQQGSYGDAWRVALATAVLAVVAVGALKREDAPWRLAEGLGGSHRRGADAGRSVS